MNCWTTWCHITEVITRLVPAIVTEELAFPPRLVATSIWRYAIPGCDAFIAMVASRFVTRVGYTTGLYRQIAVGGRGLLHLSRVATLVSPYRRIYLFIYTV